ncbi:MAG: hypothetical protein RIK87_17285 [Fuerstiella sp.]
MLSITTSAWKRLTQLKAARPDVEAIRLTLKDGAFKCARGGRRELDRVIDHPGGPTLLMSRRVAKNLSGRTLDTLDTKKGPRLRLQPETNPKQQ